MFHYMVVYLSARGITNFRSKFFAFPVTTKYRIFILNAQFRPIKTTIPIHRAVVVAFACFCCHISFIGGICELCREISTLKE